MRGGAGRDGFDARVPMADRALIRHRQLPQSSADRLVAVAVIVADRRLDDPAISLGFRDQPAVGGRSEDWESKYSERINLCRSVGMSAGLNGCRS